MGFGISGFVDKAISAVFNKALIEWSEKEEDRSLGSLATEYLLGLVSSDHITPDVKKSEVHKFTSTVTENALESGAIVSEHVIQRPIRITLQFEETNSGFGNRYMSKVANAIGFDSTFDKLVYLWENKIECTLTTEHARYTNMVIENMPIVHKEPYRGAIQIMCDFKKLNKRSLIDSYRAKDIGTSKSSQSTIEGGMQQTKKVG